VVSLFRAAVLAAFLASCGGAESPSPKQVSRTQFSSKASFAREGYVAKFPIAASSGQTVLEISCYSLNDQKRENFALANGTDPVADLSCYVKDMSREHEFTMLGLKGESLQFTPAFFWLTEIGKCGSGSYRMEASLRGIDLSFNFSNINLGEKSADLDVLVRPMPSASNDSLTDRSYEARCI
jgi:hypothetical protein